MSRPAAARTASITLACAFALLPALAFADYDKPPQPLLGVLHAPLPSTPMLDPTRQRILLIQQSQYPPIERVAEPYLKLAGVRIEPRNHARHERARHLHKPATGKEGVETVRTGAYLLHGGVLFHSSLPYLLHERRRARGTLKHCARRYCAQADTFNYA